MSKLTIESAKEAIKELRKIKGDDEAAHSTEDNLYNRFIRELSEGQHTYQESRDIAKILIKSKGIDFERWCA